MSNHLDLMTSIAGQPIKTVEDIWSDPDAERLSAKLASEAYALYGLPGLVADEKPIVGKAYHEGMIGYHLAPGDHQITTFDWHLYMDFADKHLKKK